MIFCGIDTYFPQEKGGSQKSFALQKGGGADNFVYWKYLHQGPPYKGLLLVS